MQASDKLALVTGSAQGIGLAIATALARAGHPVALLDRDPRVVDSARQLCDAGLRARALCMDISDEAEVTQLPRQLDDDWNRLSILVNNAGISPKTDGRKRLVAEMPTEEWRRVLDVNLTGTFLVTRTCLPPICSHGWGRIVMVTSQAARTRTPVPGAHYSATKAGMTGLARVLAGEVAVHGVTVNCVAPGRIESPMTAVVDPSVNARHAAGIPLQRMGTPQDVAGAVAFLASEHSAYMTGATLDVNGGSFML